MSSALRVERRLPLNASVTEIPALRSGVIPRAHLGPLREAAQGSRVVLISAPAGGGGRRRLVRRREWRLTDLQ